MAGGDQVKDIDEVMRKMDTPKPFIPPGLETPQESDPGKRYAIGVYEGRFAPFHKGHAHCIDVASSECDVLYIPMLYTVADDIIYHNRSCDYKCRMLRMLEYIVRKEDNIKLFPVDRMFFIQDGDVNKYAMATYVKSVIGHRIDAVYSSEPSYTDFYTKAYPEAVHRLIDPQRKEVPISGAKIRSMPKEDAEDWLI